MKHSVTYYIDNDDGLVSLHIQDMTFKNLLERGKPDTVGRLTAIIVNNIDWLKRGESFSITISKED